MVRGTGNDRLMGIARMCRSMYECMCVCMVRIHVRMHTCHRNRTHWMPHATPPHLPSTLTLATLSVAALKMGGRDG